MGEMATGTFTQGKRLMYLEKAFFRPNILVAGKTYF
jgi:hypothetical protein